MKFVKFKKEVTDEDIEKAVILCTQPFTAPKKPEVQDLINRCVNSYVNDEFVQEIEDCFIELFSTGKYEFYDGYQFVSNITQKHIAIPVIHYPWFKHLVSYMRPTIRKMRDLS